MIFSASPDSTQRTVTRILVVEDDHRSRLALVQILKLHGYDVLSAPTLTQALVLLSTNPASILLDLMLPDGNGMDILRRIRQQKLPIRVAILTGADKPMIAQAQTLNPDALFTKPIDLPRLFTWLQVV